MPKIVPPELGAESFACPHCGAHAHQTWFRLFATRSTKGQKPKLPTPDLIETIKQNRTMEPEIRNSFVRYYERAMAKEVFLEGQHALYSEPEVINVFLSGCYSCNGMSIWQADNLLYPAQKLTAVPNEDMPEDVRLDFLEAGAIIDSSARGAAALLRLAIQKLMPHLGEKGKNINDDIGSLVKKGLDARVQQALDAVRVIGNSAVHPGAIDLKDDKATAMQLFGLVNYIVETQISAPKKIAEIYRLLPASAVGAIEKRDGMVSETS